MVTPWIDCPYIYIYIYIYIYSERERGWERERGEIDRKSDKERERETVREKARGKREILGDREWEKKRTRWIVIERERERGGNKDIEREKESNEVTHYVSYTWQELLLL